MDSRCFDLRAVPFVCSVLMLLACRGSHDDQPGPQGVAVPASVPDEPSDAVGRRAADDDPREVPHPELVEIRTSNIPGAGKGLFAKVDIAVDTYLGDYTGAYLTEDEADELPGFESAYLFQIPACVDTKYDNIAGDPEHYVSKVNYAPSTINGVETELQNVDFKLLCEKPYVRLYSIRDVDAGEELYSDYGGNYDYDFMERADVQQFFLKRSGVAEQADFVFEYTDDS